MLFLAAAIGLSGCKKDDAATEFDNLELTLNGKKLGSGDYTAELYYENDQGYITFSFWAGELGNVNLVITNFSVPGEVPHLNPSDPNQVIDAYFLVTYVDKNDNIDSSNEGKVTVEKASVGSIKGSFSGVRGANFTIDGKFEATK